MKRLAARIFKDLFRLEVEALPVHDEVDVILNLLRLIDAAPLSERAALAARLASYPSAPCSFWSDWRAM